MAPTIARLFFTFVRLGIVAFGGPATVVHIRRRAVEKERWLDAHQFDDGVALCQVIPGATAMQVAAFVGLASRGVSGAAVCYIGFALPSFLVMLAFAGLYSQAHGLPPVVAAFAGLQTVIVTIIANATLAFAQQFLRDGRRILIAALAAVLFAWGGQPFGVIVLAGSLGLLLVASTPIAPGVSKWMHSSWKKTLPIITIAGGILAWLWLADRQLFDLATLMLRIDLFAFGGGYASVPLMLHEIVGVRHWLTEATFMNGIVLGQVTPGPIVITATFVGYLLRGLAGAAVATGGIFLPSFILVVGLAPVFDRLRASPLFGRIIGGVLCSFVGLLFTTTVHFATQVSWDAGRVALAVAALAALRLKVDVLWVVIAVTAVSVVFFR